MLTAREELLAAAVNDRIARQKSADRWWWLADWQDWLRGACWGLVAIAPFGLYFWFHPAAKGEETYFVLFGIAAITTGITSHLRSRRQQSTIARLEERVKALEEAR